MTLHTTLRDHEVEVKVYMAPAELDVGILFPYVDEYYITDEETRETLNWELTDEELATLAELADEHILEQMYDRYDD